MVSCYDRWQAANEEQKEAAAVQLTRVQAEMEALHPMHVVLIASLRAMHRLWRDIELPSLQQRGPVGAFVTPMTAWPDAWLLTQWARGAARPRGLTIA